MWLPVCYACGCAYIIHSLSIGRNYRHIDVYIPDSAKKGVSSTVVEQGDSAREALFFNGVKCSSAGQVIAKQHQRDFSRSFLPVPWPLQRRFVSGFFKCKKELCKYFMLTSNKKGIYLYT